MEFGKANELVREKASYIGHEVVNTTIEFAVVMENIE